METYGIPDSNSGSRETNRQTNTRLTLLPRTCNCNYFPNCTISIFVDCSLYVVPKNELLTKFSTILNCLELLYLVNVVASSVTYLYILGIIQKFNLECYFQHKPFLVF